ncbi:M23 family metallopeptidase [Texcoconibacillus texcoconensis]|nr:M23 family metallopeptidase [Texcoconibacillus texcoconensis]
MFFHTSVMAEESTTDILKERKALYEKMEAVTQIPWNIFAGADSYERGIRKGRNDRPQEDGAIAIYFSPEEWAGEINPNKEDTDPLSIQLFGGKGVDGNGDGISDRKNDEDILMTFASHLQKYGTEDEDLKIGLWEYYQRDKAVDFILGHAKIYKTLDSLDTDKYAFPVPTNRNYSYKNTWGDSRGWGGRRIHEGTDIFADQGTPVYATTYGIVELVGWNKYGGWRIGIRDTNNVYHYFAHLSRYEEDMDRGKMVEPGEVIGYVGSTGYGPKGTQGKFPSHLHYGMYRDNGYIEWSFDPFPNLKRWEKQS